MKVWIDAQLSPQLARWLQQSFDVEAVAVRDLELRDSRDEVIYMAARKEDAVVMTKDVDFVDLLQRHGPPPKVIWITCGNTSKAALQKVISRAWSSVVALLTNGEPLVEIH
jgi:predicted nuclease of predicted toxin-antitoxin system